MGVTFWWVGVIFFLVDVVWCDIFLGDCGWMGYFSGRV